MSMADDPKPEQRLKGSRADVVKEMRREVLIRLIEGVEITEAPREHMVTIKGPTRTTTVDVRGAKALGFYDWFNNAMRSVGGRNGDPGPKSEALPTRL
jgi:hypothetical protein